MKTDFKDLIIYFHQLLSKCANKFRDDSNTLHVCIKIIGILYIQSIYIVNVIIREMIAITVKSIESCVSAICIWIE